MRVGEGERKGEGGRNHTDEHEEEAHEGPTALALGTAADQDGDEGEDDDGFEHDGERHEEADAAPHRAEVAVGAVAIGERGEMRAAAAGRRAAPVQAVCVGDWVAAGLPRHVSPTAPAPAMEMFSGEEGGRDRGREGEREGGGERRTEVSWYEIQRGITMATTVRIDTARPPQLRVCVLVSLGDDVGQVAHRRRTRPASRRRLGLLSWRRRAIQRQRRRGRVGDGEGGEERRGKEERGGGAERRRGGEGKEEERRGGERGGERRVRGRRSGMGIEEEGLWFDPFSR